MSPADKIFVEFQAAAQFEPLDNLAEIGVVEIRREDFAYRVANDLSGHCVATFEFAFVFQFELSGNGGQGRIQVHNARDGSLSFDIQGAAFGVGDNIFEN